MRLQHLSFRTMISFKAFYVHVHGLILLLSHALVFILGYHITSHPSSIEYITRYRCYLTSTTNDKNNISLFDMGKKYQTDKVTTHHYDVLYEKYLPKYIGTNVSLLEIGLGCGMEYGPGASAYLWRDYLGPQADIHFIEFDHKCGGDWYQNHGIKLNITMHYGSQEDVAFLNSITNQRGYFDVIIDDGGHTMKQQIASITYLLPKVRSEGIYVIEDLHTSYMASHNGGYLRSSTTIEFIKRLIDDINTHSPSRESAVLAKRIFSFEISDKICFFNVM